MSTVAQIQHGFPPGIAMPEELHRLCDFLDRHGYPLSGGTELRPGGDAVLAWFGSDAATATQFAAFGAGPDGSLLALWLYQGPDSTIAPVVHLGSEGVGSVVLAETFRHFLALLGIGYAELGFDDLHGPPEDAGSAAALRAWLQERYGIVCPPTGAALVQEAQRYHSSLEEWITAWQDGLSP